MKCPVQELMILTLTGFIYVYSDFYSILFDVREMRKRNITHFVSMTNDNYNIIISINGFLLYMRAWLNDSSLVGNI